LLSLGTSSAVSTILVALTNSVVIDAWALVSWFSIVAFLGLMYYAMSAGLMSHSQSRSDQRRVTRGERGLATQRYVDYDGDEEHDGYERDAREARYARAL
jgi:hypothetical protein